MFDPFESVDTIEASTIDDEMVLVSLPLVNKTIGVNEGLFMGLIVGILLCQFFGVKLMTLPSYPNPGSETVINDPGHYIGYFQAYCPESPSYPFIPVKYWNVISCEQLPGVGSHGGCSNCIMSLIELQYIGPDIDPPIVEPPIVEPIENKNIWWYLLILILLLLMLGDK